MDERLLEDLEVPLPVRQLWESSLPTGFSAQCAKAVAGSARPSIRECTAWLDGLEVDAERLETTGADAVLRAAYTRLADDLRSIRRLWVHEALAKVATRQLHGWEVVPFIVEVIWPLLLRARRPGMWYRDEATIRRPSSPPVRHVWHSPRALFKLESPWLQALGAELSGPPPDRISRVVRHLASAPYPLDGEAVGEYLDAAASVACTPGGLPLGATVMFAPAQPGSAAHILRVLVLPGHARKNDALSMASLHPAIDAVTGLLTGHKCCCGDRDRWHLTIGDYPGGTDERSAEVPVYGPSAGLPVALALVAAETGLPLRDGVYSTGGIEPKGALVGLSSHLGTGLCSKASALALHHGPVDAPLVVGVASQGDRTFIRNTLSDGGISAEVRDFDTLCAASAGLLQWPGVQPGSDSSVTVCLHVGADLQNVESLEKTVARVGRFPLGDERQQLARLALLRRYLECGAVRLMLADDPSLNLLELDQVLQRLGAAADKVVGIRRSLPTDRARIFTKWGVRLDPIEVQL